jgi:Translation elongation factor EF-1beta
MKSPYTYKLFLLPSHVEPALIAKSNIILDVKPWGDDTDMKEMEKQVRAIQMDGLLWGASKLAPLAYGINKLQISCVVEDDLVSVDALQESIQDIEDYVSLVFLKCVPNWLWKFGPFSL